MAFKSREKRMRLETPPPSVDKEFSPQDSDGETQDDAVSVFSVASPDDFTRFDSESDFGGGSGIDSDGVVPSDGEDLSPPPEKKKKSKSKKRKWDKATKDDDSPLYVLSGTEHKQVEAIKDMFQKTWKPVNARRAGKDIAMPSADQYDRFEMWVEAFTSAMWRLGVAPNEAYKPWQQIMLHETLRTTVFSKCPMAWNQDRKYFMACKTPNEVLEFVQVRKYLAPGEVAAAFFCKVLAQPASNDETKAYADQLNSFGKDVIYWKKVGSLVANMAVGWRDNWPAFRHLFIRLTEKWFDNKGHLSEHDYSGAMDEVDKEYLGKEPGVTGSAFAMSSAPPVPNKFGSNPGSGGNSGDRPRQNGRQSGPRPAKKPTGPLVCHFCGEPGHFQRNCADYKKSQENCKAAKQSQQPKN
ncbi:Retrotransposon Gag protein [Diutina catenulata]